MSSPSPLPSRLKPKIRIKLNVSAPAHLLPENHEPNQVDVDEDTVPQNNHHLLQFPAKAALKPERKTSRKTSTDMETTQGTSQSGAQPHVPSRPSPFTPADQLPLHRNPPLAPSQELAYREKCIQLRRRITEIEKNNDETRARIAAEKNFHQKMRLNRAILLDHLRTVMESKGGKPITIEQLKTMLGPELTEDPTEDLNYEQLQSNSKKRRRIAPVDEEMLDDYSTETEEEDPEPVERPVRARRADNSQAPRDVLMANTGVTQTPLGTTNQSMYNYPNTSGLPSLAPAASSTSFSSSSKTNPTMLPSSFPVSTQQQPTFIRQQPQTPTDNYTIPPHPEHPDAPYAQFTDHMRPQLLKDSYPTELIADRIHEEWVKLSPENKQLWEDRYQEQMAEYTTLMDNFKKWQRRMGVKGSRDD